MTVEEMIAQADAYLTYECGGTDAVIAKAWLMRADFELRLEERAERDRGLSAEVAKRLAFELPILNAPGDSKVIPARDGAGFVISGWPDALGLNRDAIITVWEATRPYRVAGWHFRFVFDGLNANGCKNHVPCSQDAPFCQYCGHEDAR